MSHLRVLGDQLLLVVADQAEAEAVILTPLRRVKVRCRNPKCRVVVAAGQRCGSCGHSLDNTEVLHHCLEAGHRRAG